MSSSDKIPETIKIPQPVTHEIYEMPLIEGLLMIAMREKIGILCAIRRYALGIWAKEPRR